MKDSPDDDHGMGSHDLDHDVTTKLGKIVHANNWIREEPNVRTCLVLEQGVHIDLDFRHPFHVGDETDTREPFLSAASADVVDHGTGSIWIEESTAQMRIRPLAQIELAHLLPCCRVDPN